MNITNNLHAIYDTVETWALMTKLC